MDPELIPFDSDEDVPTKRNRLSKEEQIYGIFYDKPGKPPKPEKVKKPKDLNEFELNKTYGKGLSLLQKHGYKVGDGLGKNSQGTTQIVNVKIRRKNEGLSFSQPEVNPEVSEPLKPAANPKLKTQKAPEKANEATRVTVYEDTLLSLDYEEKQLERNIQELDQKSSEISSMISILSNTQEDWSSLLSTFAQLRPFSIFHDFFIHQSFVVPIFQNFFKQKWENWQFKGRELEGFNEFQSYLNLGQAEDVLDLWEAKVISFFANFWEAKEELGESIDALEMWKSIIPSESFQLVSKTILSKLAKEIEDWDPFTDKIAIHTWVLPWLGLIDLSSLFPKVIKKFELALDKWQAKDRSAKLLIKPWKNVLGSEWDNLVILHVLPKLLKFLREFEIPEECSKTKSLRCVFEWVGLIPIDSIADGFKVVFYPRLKRVLQDMLPENPEVENMSDCEIEKINEWVKYWKNKIPDEILRLDF